MKTKTGILISTLVILVAAYTGIWWTKSNELKDQVARSLVEMSQQENATVELTYDKLERAGYPFGIELAFTNPKLIQNGHGLKVLHEGGVVIGRSILNQDKVWIKTTGKTDLTLVAKAEGDRAEEKEHLLISGKTYLECIRCGGHLHIVNNMLHSDLTFGEWIPLLLADSTFKMNDFKVFQIGKNKSEPNLILEIKKGLFNVKNKEEVGNNHFTIDVDVKNMISGVNQKTVDLIKPLYPNLNEEEFKKSFMELGGSDLVFQAHGFIPTTDHPFYQSPSWDTLPTFSLVVDKSEQKSVLAENKSHGTLEFQRSADKKFTGVVKFEQKSKASDKFHSVAVKIVDRSMNKNSEKAKLLAEHSAELIPDLAQFGVIENLLDLKFQGDESGPGFPLQSIDLKNYTLACELYGLKINGKAEDLEHLKAHWNIQLENYKNLFADMLNYYTKWQKLLAQAKTKSQLPVITPHIVERVEQFLETLSTNAKPKQLNIEIAYEEPGPAKIGTKTIEEVFAAWRQLETDLEAEYKKSNPEETQANQVEAQEAS
jgi:hypothetical protein